MKEKPGGGPAGFFEAEAAGLRWLAVDGGAACVSVLDVRTGRIEIERLTEAPASAAAAEEFGRALAVTHAAGAEAFGSGPTGGPGVAFIGRQELPLGSYSSWGAFYADLRLLPYSRAAHRIGNLSDAGLRSVEKVCERLHAGEFDDGRPPARIHGDLWAGNLLFTPTGAVMIDPAAHGGHGETDLAMLALFGAPHLRRIQQAYAEAASLDSGWPDRIALHQLHPLLVHAVTHGASYGSHAAEHCELALAGR
ncbi:phosphotransferase [Nakamurella sp. YIM 132087]|uniref:Phosphotransferase n=1 Tax=Nakamurella alba TaxID=2665158 RepID=A0A7K1FLD6_9ACTN|nr:fructosamine kinase family protein [Nakamurella alba]MTD13694.1 phosphotransferase [Nakamurella alba]